MRTQSLPCLRVPESEKVTILSYRLPNGTIPVLLSSDVANLLQGEAAAVLCYATGHPEVAPQAISDMLFRTRIARKHRALAMVTNRDELISALQAVIDGREHPALVRGTTPATARRLAYVFPGQGGQRPGMGRLFYESVPAFRAEADRCAEAFDAQFGESPLDYLLNEHLLAQGSAATVQPALFTQMAGLAAMWRSFGIAPNVTIGHSQGEIAAAYVSGTITLTDAACIIGIRARAADEFAPGDYAMAVVAADRDACEDLIARCSGWAELSVVNSPNMVGISGDRETVQGIVDTCTERGRFARVIDVQYPAHTSLINQLGENLRATTQRELQNPKFLDTDIDCLGATLGGRISQDLPVEQYWFWNLRNTVRFDKAIAAALPLGTDTFVELAEHPTLQLAIQDNLAALTDETGERETMVVGTSDRTATDLSEFTRNLALLAVHDLDYPWESLGTELDGPAPLPLLDFPNTRMNEVRLWQHYVPSTVEPPSPVKPVAVEVKAAPVTTSPRLLAEEWMRLSHRSLVPPRAIGIVDHTGACADLANALCATAGDVGATARVIDLENPETRDDLDTHVILLPASPELGLELDGAATAAEVAAFFGNRTWWPGVDGAITDCWLVTVGGEVVTDDAPPDPVHAAASAGFRCVGAEHPGVRFRHLDLDAGSASPESAVTILRSLHTAGESELALRNGGLYAKRIIEDDSPPAETADANETPPEHALIIGGTGKLGLEFCEHLARRGARQITLVSRSGETPAVADRLHQIRADTSTRIRVSQCDVGDQAAVSELAREHHDAPADLIIHAAVEYSGAELSDITGEKVDQALRAKVAGISRVLSAFPRTDRCRVVLCSSIAATVGGRGLIVYAAANRMLDAMAHRLRAQGVDCVSVQWGQWTVTFDPDAAGTAQLAVTGLLPMSTGDALELGMRTLGGNRGIVALELERARSVLETCGRGSLLSELSLPDVKTTVPVDEADLPQRLMKLLAQAIGVEHAETIDTEVPMVAIGLDSLQALELRRRVKIEFNHDLEVSDLLGGASIADVLAQLSA
jgi:mycobactin polyketide synthetase MbtD